MLLRDCPYALRSDGADVQQQAVILVIVSNDEAALLLHGQHVLHVVLDVGSCLDEGSFNVAVGEVYNIEAVLQVADDAHYLVVLFLLLEHGEELRYAECRDVEPLTREGIEIVQTVGVLLEPGIATIATHEDIGVHEDVV